MVKCVFCGILGYNKKNESLHRFPRDEPLRKEWLKLIGLDGLSVQNSTRLCSNHFPKDCFIEHFCSRRSLKPGSVPTIFKKEARFQKQQDVSVETNCTDKAQDVATMSKKENCEPQRNILMKINSIDNDAEPTSITEQIPEASTIVEYSDSPTMSKDILSQEDCCSPSTSYAFKKKYECVTARDIVCHDHHYEDTLRSMKRKFNVL